MSLQQPPFSSHQILTTNNNHGHAQPQVRSLARPCFAYRDCPVDLGGCPLQGMVAVETARGEPGPLRLDRGHVLWDVGARRLQRLGLLRMVHPEDLTPQRLASELTHALSEPPPLRGSEISFSGLDRLAEAVGHPMVPQAAAPVYAGGQL